MSDIPAELVPDILSRLPVKPLLQFRCVSKSWRALIDSPDFIKLHLNRSIETNSNLSIVLRDSYLYSVDFDSLDNAVELNHHPLWSDSYGTEVLGSCNGLLCLSNTEEDIVLWNPSTRKYRKLPITTIVFPEGFSVCQYIVYGFGYDHVNDDYKLVRMVQFYGEDDDSFDSEVKVYSLESNSWRRIQDFPYYLRYKRANAMLAGGALHWVVSRKPESDTANLIAAFDIGTEEYRLVPQPNYSDKNFHMNLDVLGGCLCVLCNYYLDHFDIWVMKDYGVGESWTKLISVAQPKQIRSFEVLSPITYSKSGGQVLLEQDHKRLLWYDLEKKTIKNVRICGLKSELQRFFEADIYWGSLVQLNVLGGNDEKKEPAQEKAKKKQNLNKRDDFLSRGFKLVL